MDAVRIGIANALECPITTINAVRIGIVNALESTFCSITTIEFHLVKPGVPACGRHVPGFLELLLSANFCMCVCVSAPEAINNYSREVKLYRAITQTLEL